MPNKKELLAQLEQLRSFAEATTDSQKEEQAMMLAALIHAITEHDAGQGKRSYSYALPNVGGAGGSASWHNHVREHFKTMAGHFANMHEHLRPHINNIAEAAHHHFNTLKNSASAVHGAFHSKVLPHARAHLGSMGEAVTHHLGTLAHAGKMRAEHYVGSFGRYHDNIKKAVSIAQNLHHSYRVGQQARKTAGVRARHPGATTVSQHIHGQLSFADGSSIEDEDEGTPEEQAKGLHLAQQLIEEHFTPEQIQNLATVDDDDDDRSFAAALPSTGAPKRPPLVPAGAARFIAETGANMALNRGLRSKDARTRIRSQAIAHAHGQIMTHAGRASAATFSPIATARVAGSYWLEHKRNRLKGVGYGNKNAMNASHYLVHHGEAVEKLAQRHGVSKLTMAHSLAYTAAALHQPRKGKFTAEENLNHHRNLGIHAIQTHAKWRISK